MMGEEIDVDCAGQRHRRPDRRVAGEAKIEDAPDPCNIAADGGIHEAGEERHRADVEQAGFGIHPGAGLRLEQFHDRANEVEGEDDLGLRPAFQAKGQHGRLDRERRQRQEIIAVQRGVGGIEKMRRQQQ